MNRRGTARIVAACAVVAFAGCEGAQRHSLCEIVRQPAAYHGRVVRVSAVGVFTRHGAVLEDNDCPEETLDWTESLQFAESAEADALSSAAYREQFGEFRNIRVDVTGTFQAGEGHEHRLEVRRLHHFSVIPASARIMPEGEKNEPKE